VAGKLVELDMDLVSWLQLWMPWKHFNYTSLSLYAGACYYMSLVAHVWPYVSLSSFTYSAPLAAKYCPQQQCLHCSEPFEWDPHPYQPCRSLVPLADSATNGNMINSTHTDTVKIEVASPHLAFHGLLFCFTAPQVNLTQDTVQVDLIKEGGKICEKVISIVPSYSKGAIALIFPEFLPGKLYDAGGTVVHPSFSAPFLEAYTGGSSELLLERVEYGVLSDFLANDEYYASSFEYQRYDQFRTWAYTREIAKGLLRPGELGHSL
jgi:hypothetical protein